MIWTVVELLKLVVSDEAALVGVDLAVPVIDLRRHSLGSQLVLLHELVLVVSF